MSKYECNVCGSSAYYDGRCGDGPILMCGCAGKAIDSNTGYYGGPPPRKTREVIKGSNGTTVIIIRKEDYDYGGPGGRYRQKNGKVWDY